MDNKEKRPAYDIDDILLEAQRLKQQRQKAAPAAAPAAPRPAPQTAPPATREPAFPVSAAPKQESPAAAPARETGELPAKGAVFFEEEGEGKEKKRKKPGRFHSRREEEWEESGEALPSVPVSTETQPSVQTGTVPRPAPLPNAPAAPIKPTPLPHAPAQTPPAKPVKTAPVAPLKPVPVKSSIAPVIRQPAAKPQPEKVSVLLPEEDDVRIYEPASRSKAAEENAPAAAVQPPLPAPERAAAADDATRIVELPGRVKTVTKTTQKPLPLSSEEDEMEGQLSLEDYVGEEQQEGESETDWEERLRKTRQEKVSAFRLLSGERSDGFKLSGEDEEDNDPSEEPDQFDDEELEDFSSYEEADAVLNELVYRRRTGWITTMLTGVAELVLIWLTLMAHLSVTLPIGVNFYIALHAFLLLVMMLINHRMVGMGIANLFRLRADADSAVTAASLFTLLHTLSLFFNSAAVASGEAVLFTGAAGFGLLLGAVGGQMRLGRICENFRFVSHPSDKYAAHRIDDPKLAVEIGRSAVALGEPEVAYFKKTGFLDGFLENSYGDDGSDRAMRLYVPLSVLASAVLGVGALLIGKATAWNALSLGIGTLCLASPAAALMSSNFPLLRTAKRLLRRGAMLIGWEAVRGFGELHALAVDAQELFPSENVLLHGIKTFSGARIDEALLDAAAVSIAAGGPLSGVFRRVIENKTDMLPAVDTLVYEQDMGLSGWVGGRRVLVGNRRLLENHGVDVPSRDYENRYAKGDRRLVYLSTAGELSAMFVVSYVADDGIRQALHDLEKCGITLLVRTCDPNVTEQLVCDTFEMDSYYVEIMGVTAGRSFEKLMSEPETANPEAILASNGRVEGMAAALTGCRRLRTGVALAVAAQVVGGVLGLVLGAFLAFTSGLPLPPLYTLLYLLGWAAVSWLLPVFRKI